jgi:ABC-type antimicrobial peptide transport system permease subunit
MVGRLKNDVRLDQAALELETIAGAELAEFPRPQWASLGDGFIISRLQDDLTRSVKPVLFVALALAAIGTYSLLSGSVAERTREIGVRSALGASRRSVLALVLRQGMMLAGIGIVTGMAGAMITSRALVTLLFGVSRLDLTTYLGVLLLLAGVSAIACGIPAWRAARISPSVALRSE